MHQRTLGSGMSKELIVWAKGCLKHYSIVLDFFINLQKIIKLNNNKYAAHHLRTASESAHINLFLRWNQTTLQCSTGPPSTQSSEERKEEQDPAEGFCCIWPTEMPKQVCIAEVDICTVKLTTLPLHITMAAPRNSYTNSEFLVLITPMSN